MPDILKAQKKEKVFTWKGEIIMYEDNDMRKDDSFATGSYYDTSSSYTHYDSAEAMKQPKKLSSTAFSLRKRDTDYLIFLTLFKRLWRAKDSVS